MKNLFLIMIVIFLFSCNRDKLDPTVECETEVTYTNDIKNIMESSCAYVGCHLNGAAPGDFSSYSGIESFTSNGKISSRVLEIMNMPPQSAPADKPKTLTQEELDLFSCWAEGDYTE